MPIFAVIARSFAALRATTPAMTQDAVVRRSRMADWIADEVLRRKVLVDNPARLYGFPT
jgi:hypothetical protein